MAIKAVEEDRVLKLDKITSKDIVQVTKQDGSKQYLSNVQKADKNETIEIKSGEVVTIEFPVFPEILQYSGSLRRRHNELDSSVWKVMDDWQEADAVSIHAMH